MAASTPYAQLVGPCKIFLAAASTTEPTVNTTPGGGWVELGATEGEQKFGHEAPNTYFYDNDHQGPVKAVTPQEDITITFTLVGLTQEHFSRILHNVSQVTAAAGPPAVSRTPFKAGFIPTEYAILFKGDADSPYGNFPAQNYIPRGCFEKTIEITRGKEPRASIACEFKALEDDTQSDANKLGWATAQTS